MPKVILLKWDRTRTRTQVPGTPSPLKVPYPQGEKCKQERNEFQVHSTNPSISAPLAQKRFSKLPPD